MIRRTRTNFSATSRFYSNYGIFSVILKAYDKSAGVRPALRGCCNLLEDHLEGAVVEGVAAHHPHDLFLHHNLVRRPGKGCSKGLDTGQDPEGLCWRDSQRAIWTYGRNMEKETMLKGWHFFALFKANLLHIPSKMRPFIKKVAGREEEKQTYPLTSGGQVRNLYWLSLWTNISFQQNTALHVFYVPHLQGQLAWLQVNCCAVS